MMDRLSRAKKEYQNIEIPQELSTVVEDAIKKSEQKNTYRINIFKKVVPAVSVCAILCLVIGTSSFLRQDSGDVNVSEGDAELMVASENSRMMPAPSAKTEAVMDMSQPEMSEAVLARIEAEKANGNSLSPIFIGKKYASFMSVDESGDIKYFNFTVKDGSEVALSDLGIDGYKADSVFYISSENCAVVILGNRAEEVTFR